MRHTRGSPGHHIRGLVGGGEQGGGVALGGRQGGGGGDLLGLQTRPLGPGRVQAALHNTAALQLSEKTPLPSPPHPDASDKQ